MSLKRPEQLTVDEIIGFTSEFKVPLLARMHLNSANHGEPSLPIIWPSVTKADYARIDETMLGQMCHYPEAIRSFRGISFEGARCCVIGSSRPWLELLLLLRGARRVMTIEYRKIEWNLFEEIQSKWDSRVYEETLFDDLGEKYDYIISYSSLEHSGLGRYGDEINPDGDIQTLRGTLKLAHDKTIWLIGVPLGQDAILFNRHRVYGTHRLGRIAEVLRSARVEIVKMPPSPAERVCLPAGDDNPLSSMIGSDGVQRLLIFRR